MITYEEALKKALTYLDDINTCDEYTNIYQFSRLEDRFTIGPQPIVVIKETGECMKMLDYSERDHDQGDHIRYFRVELDDDSNTKELEALHNRCYDKYNGTNGYEQDFYGARDDAEQLFERTKDPGYANTLGYIYYYGRCNDGKPEYDKALQYFLYGASNGVYESIYKLSDMFINGYGVIKSEETAFNILMPLYNDLSNQYFQDQGGEELADVGLRLGSMFLHGQGTEQNSELAVMYLLQAKNALLERMEKEDFFGNSVVLNSIRTNLNEALTKLQEELQ